MLLAITTLSLTPLSQLPALPGSDKTHHIIAYSALMFPTALRRPKGWMLIAAFFILHGGLIELLQPYVNRYGEWLDMAANTAGILCGVILAAMANHFFKPSRLC
uniref:VanZ-like domain-containing protein n=1 Tax=Magnetococcus massalia (strain MO-1) TaxID=451514 RepID=A0A1S7LM16_MAGMO|nr:Conserved protein of unknown function [Candidatus Magnetococcus massalia]